MRPEIYVDAKGEHRSRIVARNGRTLFDSGEGYKTEAGARKALEAVARWIERDSLVAVIALRSPKPPRTSPAEKAAARKRVAAARRGAKASPKVSAGGAV